MDDRDEDDREDGRSHVTSLVVGALVALGAVAAWYFLYWRPKNSTIVQFQSLSPSTTPITDQETNPTPTAAPSTATPPPAATPPPPAPPPPPPEIVGILDLGVGDWFLAFDTEAVAFVHRTNHRRHLFTLTGKYTTDTAANTITYPRMAPATPLRNAGSRDWLIHTGPRFAGFVHRGNRKRHMFSADGAYTTDDGGAEQLDAVADVPLTSLYHGNTEWYIAYDPSHVALVNVKNHRRHLFGSNGRLTTDENGKR